MWSSLSSLNNPSECEVGVEPGGGCVLWGGELPRAHGVVPDVQASGQAMNDAIRIPIGMM